MTDLEKQQKVIKGLEHCIEKLDFVFNKSHGFNCIDCPYFRKCDRSGYLTGLPLMRDTLALLKTREPKRVHVTADICYRKVGECPNCGKLINSNDHPYFCGTCGRAVKWNG